MAERCPFGIPYDELCLRCPPRAHSPKLGLRNRVADGVVMATGITMFTLVVFCLLALCGAIVQAAMKIF